MEQEQRGFSLSSNVLKLLALASMTLDHTGLMLFPHITWLRIVGRLAFPIFAFMIAEGCRYTKHPARYLLIILAEGILCQTVQYFADGSVMMNVLLTFSLSIICIYAIRHGEKLGGFKAVLPPLIAIALALFMCVGLPALMPWTGFRFDYGFIGAMLPIIISLPSSREGRLAAAAVGTAALSMTYGGIQWWSLLALIPLALYAGERGRLRLKYLFYIYYPLHFVVLWLIAMLWH